MIDIIPLLVAGGILLALGILAVMMSWNSLVVLWNFAKSLWALINTLVSLGLVVYVAYLLYDFLDLHKLKDGVKWEPGALKENFMMTLSVGRTALRFIADWVVEHLAEVTGMGTTYQTSEGHPGPVPGPGPQ